MLTRGRKRFQAGIAQESIEIDKQSQSPVKKIRLANVTNIKSKTNKTDSKKTHDNKMIDIVSGEVSLNALNITSSSQQTKSCKKSSLIEEFQSIKSSLEESYKNVTERLCLASIPRCFYNLKECARTHSPCQLQPTVSLRVEVVAKQLLDEEHYLQFISYARDCIISRKKFPGIEIIKGIFEVIMKMPKENNFKALSSLHQLVCVIFHRFPSCQWKFSYLHLLQSPIKVCKIKNRKNLESQGIFHIVLNLLNDLIYQSKDSEIAKRDSNREVNIYLWAAQENEKSSFINFPRVEKFERIFLVLDSLVALLEQDLAYFMIKHAGKLSSKITHQSRRPLICSVIWEDYDSVTVINSTIKNLISIFTDMIAMKYPQANVRIIARMLNLISHVINIFECADETSYPYYGNFTKDFVREIHLRLEDSQTCYIDAIEILPSPLIKMLLATEILQNIHNSSFYPVSLSHPINLICKKEFLKFNSTKKLEGEGVITCNGKWSESDEKYPALSQTRRAIKAEITQDCYLKLLLLLSSSINHFYRIVSSYKEVQKRSNAQTTTVSSSQSSFSDSAIKPENSTSNLQPPSFSFPNSLDNFQVDLNEKVSMRRVDLRFKKLVAIKLTIESCLFYRNEMKHLILLTKLIKKCHEKYGEEFTEWMKFVESLNIIE